jgi:hypothetical protein
VITPSAFSRAVNPGKRLKLWKMKLTVDRRMLERRVRDALVRSVRASRTVPDVGATSAPMRFNSAVLPDPDDAPSTTTKVVSSARRLTPSTALTTVPPTEKSRHASSISIRVPTFPAGRRRPASLREFVHPLTVVSATPSGRAEVPF